MSALKIVRWWRWTLTNELAELTGIPQSAISAIEHDKINLGIERAKVIAKAPRCQNAAQHNGRKMAIIAVYKTGGYSQREIELHPTNDGWVTLRKNKNSQLWTCSFYDEISECNPEFSYIVR